MEEKFDLTREEVETLGRRLNEPAGALLFLTLGLAHEMGLVDAVEVCQALEIRPEVFQFGKEELAKKGVETLRNQGVWP